MVYRLVWQQNKQSKNKLTRRLYIILAYVMSKYFIILLDVYKNGNIELTTLQLTTTVNEVLQFNSILETHNEIPSKSRLIANYPHENGILYPLFYFNYSIQH